MLIAAGGSRSKRCCGRQAADMLRAGRHLAWLQSDGPGALYLATRRDPADKVARAHAPLFQKLRAAEGLFRDEAPLTLNYFFSDRLDAVARTFREHAPVCGCTWPASGRSTIWRSRARTMQRDLRRARSGGRHPQRRLCARVGRLRANRYLSSEPFGRPAVVSLLTGQRGARHSAGGLRRRAAPAARRRRDPRARARAAQPAPHDNHPGSPTSTSTRPRKSSRSSGRCETSWKGGVAARAGTAESGNSLQRAFKPDARHPRSQTTHPKHRVHQTLEIARRQPVPSQRG